MDAGHLKLLDQEEDAVTHFLSSGRLRNLWFRAFRCVRWFFFPVRSPDFLPVSVLDILILNCVSGPAVSMPLPESVK